MKRSRLRRYLKSENSGWYSLFSIIVGIYCLVTVLMFLIVLISSLRSGQESFANMWSLPRKIITTNYVYLYTHNFGRYYLNSIVVMVASVFMTLFLASLVAFGLGKFQFKGNRLVSLYFLIGLMFPAQVGLMPLFSIVKSLHLYNSVFGLILLSSAGISIPVFIFTNFLATLPDSILESAQLDGAGTFRIYWQILIPLISPIIGAMIPLTMVGLWNSLFYPLIFIVSDSKKTVPLGLLTYYRGRGGSFAMAQYGIVFAAVSLSIFPMLILYAFGSKRIIDSITSGALKQ